jgi:hypothetical protein
MNKKVLISCRPKCGSTMVWNWFRLLSNCKAYYEPTNPILRQLIQFDPKPNPEHRHHHVNSWVSEYQNLEGFSPLFRPYFGEIDLFLSAESHSADLENLFSFLFSSPTDLVAIKDLNMLFRAGWLKKLFPELMIVYLRRSPRLLWTSTMRVIEKAYSDFKSRKNFGDTILTAYQNDLETYFPFLTDSFCPHPYYRFYFVCHLADLFNVPDADFVLDYDTLIEEPEKKLDSMFSHLGINVESKKLLEKAPFIPSPTNVAKEVDQGISFEKVEQNCEEILEKFGLVKNFQAKDFEKLRKENHMFQNHQVDPLKGRTRQLQNIYEESCERWLMVHEKENEIQNLKLACDERLDTIKKLSQ